MLKVEFDDLMFIYKRIKCNTKHKDKLFKFEANLNSNLMYIKYLLETGKYKHGKYNVFYICDPKIRIIMSENIYDKVVNNYISYFYLNPAIERKLIDTDVASRKNKGTSYAIKTLMKCFNSIKFKYNNIYVLKMDIEKYFYNINHSILKEKILKLNLDKDIVYIIFNIIDSTNEDYINEYIKKILSNNINVPLYNKGVGLCLGSNISQYLALYYLNDINHYIKEVIKPLGFCKVMDDYCLIDSNINKLKYAIKEVNNMINKLDLKLNNKTKIYNMKSGFKFIGFSFKLIDNKLSIRIMSENRKRICKKLNLLYINNYEKYLSSYISYAGYFKYERNY